MTRPRRPITTTIKLRLRAAQTYFSLPGAAPTEDLVPVDTYDSASLMAATSGYFPVHILCARTPW